MRRYCLPLIALPLLLTGCQKTGSLGGTDWTVIEVLSTTQTDIVDMDVSFGTNGMVTTTTTHADGTKEMSRRRFDVHEALITVRRGEEGDYSLLHRIVGDDMILTAESFQVRMVRLD
ncbi:MAG: hypothetical protein GY715_09390 [Planctomycetes bacterium]|nr:hypothetical protein [Planctomycetota bacterium]